MSARLSEPSGLDDLLLCKLSRLLTVGGNMVIGLCEGRFGITRDRGRRRARARLEMG